MNKAPILSADFENTHLRNNVAHIGNESVILTASDLTD